MKRQKRSIISAVLILALSVGMGTNVCAVTVDEAQQKANELETQKNSAETEKNALVAQLNTIVTEMNDTKDKLDRKQAEINKAEGELVDAKVDENNQYESMKKRIKYMYENGSTQFIEILVSSESIGDFLNKAEYVSQISAYDREMLVQFQDTVKQVEEQEAALKSEYDELNALQTALVEKQTEVQNLLSNKSLQIADLEGQIGENAAVLRDLLAQAEAERVRQAEAAAAAAAAAALAAAPVPAAPPSSGSGGYVPPVSEAPVVSGSGMFTNPCPGGYVSSTFGYRDFDASFHKGLDLAAAQGTPTYAADAGTVVIAGYSSSAGNWVVINHGNGFVTKYMHHSTLSVSPGQTVVRGQQIGTVGNTGNSFGAHLHFQVELDGVAVDPQSYL